MANPPQEVIQACSLTDDADAQRLLRYRIEGDLVVIITHEGKKYTFTRADLPTTAKAETKPATAKKPTTTRKR